MNVRTRRVTINNFRVIRGKTTVFNLRTNVQQDFDLEPRNAVIAAYAQQHGDFNTVNYEKRYQPYISGRSVVLGDWAAVIR